MKIVAPHLLPCLFPAPLVLVSCGTMQNPNIITIAWAGTVNSNPPMVSVSIRPERHSYDLIKKSGLFIVNLVSQEMLKEADFCGVKSGRDINKFEATKMTPVEWREHDIPYIKESPVSLCCKTSQLIHLGTHSMFVGEIIEIFVKEEFLESTGKLNLEAAGLVSYISPQYHLQGEVLGRYGYSVV